MWTKILRTITAVAAGAVVSGELGTADARPAVGGSACFPVSTWNGWTPVAGGDPLNLRVGLRDVYRVELSHGSRVSKYPGDFLVSQDRGSSWICSPLDLDLAISDQNGFRRPLIATGL